MKNRPRRIIEQLSAPLQAMPHPETPNAPRARRWLLVALLLTGVSLLFFLALRTPSPWTIDIGTAGDVHFSHGFSVPEQGDGATFRWSTPRAILMLHGASAGPQVLAMRLHRNQNTLNDTFTLALARGEQRFAAFDMPPSAGWRVYRVLLPAGALADTRMHAQPLALQGTTYTPGSHDRRDLGVPVEWVRVEPLAAQAATLPLLGRALFLTSVLAVLWGGLWRLRTVLLPRSRPPLDVLLVHLPAATATVGLLLWAQHSPHTLAWALPTAPWTLGLLALLLLLTTLLPRPAPLVLPPAPATLRPTVSALLLALVFVLALTLRLYHIDSLPYGLWRDEAEHGLVALRILENPAYHPIYVAEGRVNMPALGFYPFALALKLWGIHAWTLRIVTALAGALTVLPLYGLVRHLFGRPDVALLAAAFLAVSSWHLTLSRYSFPSIFEPLLALSGLWLLLLDLDSPHEGGRAILRPLLAALAGGACLGMAAQMYHTGRVVPVVVGVLALLWLWQARHRWRHWLVVATVCAVGFALVVAPLVNYALHNPDAFNDRVGSVFLLGNAWERGRAPLADFDESLGRHLLMFHVRGDSNSRHHAPDQPLLDVVTGAGFLVGFVVLLRHWRDWRSLWVFAALGIGMLPSLLAVDGPHAMRSIGAIAYACIIAAIGWRWLAGWVQQRAARATRSHPKLSPTVLHSSLLVAVVVAALALNAWTYFGYMPTERRVWTSFYPVHTQVGIYLRERAAAPSSAALDTLYVGAGLTDNPVYTYLTHGLPVQTFTNDNVRTVAHPGARFVLSGYNHPYHVGKLQPYVNPEEGPVYTGPDLPGSNEPSFVIYQAEPYGQGPPTRNP